MQAPSKEVGPPLQNDGALMSLDMFENLRRQFVYEEWANHEVLLAVRTNQDENARGLQVMAHILSAQRLWLDRLERRAQSLPVWPEFSVEECETHAAELGRLWREYFESLPPSRISHTISYKNSKGEPWTNTVLDILTHVLLHSAYHRGQIASQMRGNGQTPAYTDFVHAVRQGLID
jgi:uncharacterized damage-inducible protein DinB